MQYRQREKAGREETGKGGGSEEEGAGDSKILMRGAHSEVSQERLEPLHIWRINAKGVGSTGVVALQSQHSMKAWPEGQELKVICSFTVSSGPG